MNKLEYCIVTDNESEIQKPFVSDKSDKQFKKYGVHTGIDLKGENVYSISEGTVKRVTSKSVFVYDGNCGFLYDNLSDIFVEEGEELDYGDLLGQITDYVHFEYMTKQGGKLPFRHGNLTLFRQDPIGILEEGYMTAEQVDLADTHNEISLAEDDEYEDYLSEEEDLEFLDDSDIDNQDLLLDGLFADGGDMTE